MMKIKNAGAQLVKAPRQETVPKKSVVKTGEDLRQGCSKNTSKKK